MGKIKIAVGCFTGIISITYLSFAISYKEIRNPFIFMSVLFGFVTFLLFRKKKNNISHCNKSNKVEEKEKNDEYIETGNTIQRVDGNPISDEEIPYLIQVGLDKVYEYEKMSTNIKFHRTEHEEELSFQFKMKHGKEIYEYTNSFETYRNLAIQEKDLDKKIALLRKTIESYNKAKNFFYKTKGGTIFFQDMYEHLSNSQNQDFSYLDTIESSLNYYTNLKNNVIPIILNAISMNNGILQKDIYKYVPEFSQSHIRKIIKELEESGKIIRTKKGNTYYLTLS